jgi:hypothetical protein
MRRVLAAVESALSFVRAPGTVAGLVPWWISAWRFKGPATKWLAVRLAGGALVVSGTLMLLGVPRWIPRLSPWLGRDDDA